MSLLNKILNWTQTLPAWQRDAVRRLLQSDEGLSEDDYTQLYTLLKAEHGLPNPDQLKTEPLAARHLPASIQAGDTITLKEMRELNHVNRIAPNQTLEFNETGMTVIYGGNGTGKSGYVRVMKQACRSRDQQETVHANANDPASATLIPEAKFKVDKQGSDNVITWKRGQTSPDVLSMISVFDSHCARSYLTAEQDVAYLPYGLDIVENLARDVLPELDRRLSQEINSIDISTVAYSHLLGETEVGKQILKLGPKTNPKTIEALGTLSEEEIKRIDALNKALAEADPLAKAAELKRFVARLKTLAVKVRKATLWVDNDANQKLKKLDDDVVAAEDAEKKAAQALQSGESLLPGTGEQIWKSLFEAARKYSTEVACTDHEFPYTGNDAVCPLCQSSLDAKTGERLARFEQYIKDDVAKVAKEKRVSLGDICKKIEKADLVFAMDKELEDEIAQYDGAIVQDIKAYQESVDERRQWMLGALDTHKWDNAEALPGSPRVAVRRLAAKKLREARIFIKASDAQRKKALNDEYDELFSRQNLGKTLQGLLDLIERMKKVSALKACKRDLKTTPISNKSREFAGEAVTKELKKALDVEFANLDVGHIKTKLKEKNVKGKIYHQLLLELPTSKAIDEILSEGEQRAIALGSFLAELSLANHGCGIVFDDPVSSLDHWRRRHVARRLAQEASKRQVIVFTHDTSFLGQLRDEIDAMNLDHKIQYMECSMNYAGNVCDGLPWDHQGYKERIHTLEVKQSQLGKNWPVYPGEQETKDICDLYNLLRATIELVVQDIFLNGVIRRFHDWVVVGKLTDVAVGIDHAECKTVEKLHKRCSGLVSAHDKSSAKNSPVPSPTELAKDIQDLKDVIEIIQNRRKAKKAAKTP